MKKEKPTIFKPSAKSLAISNPDISLKDLLVFFRSVTREFQRQTHKWTLSEQINETFTEIAELNQILRHRDALEAKEEWIEELWDVVISTIVCSHCYPIEITDEDLLQGLDRTLDKLKARMKNNYYSNLKHGR